jgi:putative DNA primase/helicase
MQQNNKKESLGQTTGTHRQKPTAANKTIDREAKKKGLKPGADLQLPLRFPRTDTGNAELFAAFWKNNLRYDHQRSRWLLWLNHWWGQDQDGSVQRAAKTVVRFRFDAVPYIDNEKEADRENSWAKKSESRSRLEAMLKLAQSELPLVDDGKNWDSNPYLLGVKNGVVDLSTGQPRAGRQSDRITMHTDVEFDPAAQCPRWRQFLDEIFRGDLELIEFIQRAVGYSLTGDTSEQCLFLCYGTGANGKSTFLEVLRLVLGAYAHNLPFSAFELKARSPIPNDIAALEGRRFVTALETNESVDLNEGRIKALTGSDPVSARFLYKEFFTFISQAKFWLAFNHKPFVADDSPGFWRRIRLIPFLQRFSEETADKDLMDKLKAEFPGILAWIVEGALKWQAEGLGMPPAVKEATEAYQKESDALEDFLAERCEIIPEARVRAKELWAQYQFWVVDNSERASLDRKAFSRRMEMKGFVKRREGHGRNWFWVGLRTRTAFSPSDRSHEGSARTDADVKETVVDLLLP